ncbi:CAZyme family GH135 [Penicillium soppii]|uniref:CAZyme family GH135 n=1 Tax=Penicillium soppii TaxID=69789 RepID=UPI0025475EA2|nr:CAZyme family GH135 [Penicillium soppii]KAJ5856226.1 CAZyme family GH135 [Penicillium soppii]
MFQILSVLVTVLAFASIAQSTGVIVPLYAWPGTDVWNTVYESIAAHPSTPFYLIVNPSTGPGATEYPEDAYITAIAKLNSYSNAKVLGYTYTNHGSRAISEVESDIATYAKWSTYAGTDISVAGVFFDQTPSGEDPSFLPYFQQLSSTTKGSNLNTVVFNPGVKIVADVEAWFAAADFIVEYENTYTNWLALAPSEHFSGEANYAKDAIILNQTPADASIDTVAKLAKNLGLGAIYLTYDDNYMGLTSVSKIAVAVSQRRKVKRRGHSHQ